MTEGFLQPIPRSCKYDGGKKNGDEAPSRSISLLFMIQYGDNDYGDYERNNNQVDDGFNGYEEGQNDNRSIGDIVQGLHGGKYQFQDYGSTGLSYEGQQFAEMGYSSAPSEGSDYDDEEYYPLPNWAVKLQQITPSSLRERQATIPRNPLDANNDSAGIVTIQNDERSWEKYYAFVIGDDDSAQQCCSVRPCRGTLAPRGGVNNFPDQARIQISWDSTSSNKLEGNVWVVIGTEAERWTYQIQ